MDAPIEFKQYTVPISGIQPLDYRPGPSMIDLLHDEIRKAEARTFRPWTLPDKNPMPMFDPLPWVDRVVFWRNEIPARVRGALDVLRNGYPDLEDDW